MTPVFFRKQVCSRYINDFVEYVRFILLNINQQ